MKKLILAGIMASMAVAAQAGPVMSQQPQEEYFSVIKQASEEMTPPADELKIDVIEILAMSRQVFGPGSGNSGHGPGGGNSGIGGGNSGNNGGGDNGNGGGNSGNNGGGTSNNVPEPGTLALLSLAGVGMIAVRRKNVVDKKAL